MAWHAAERIGERRGAAGFDSTCSVVLAARRKREIEDRLLLGEELRQAVDLEPGGAAHQVLDETKK